MSETQPKQLMRRYDGRAKVMGNAKYAAEFAVKDICYAYIVQSTIAKGTVASIDTAVAERASGVIAVMTPFNQPKLNGGPAQPPARRSVTILQNAEVNYNGQPIAVVVAETQQQAMHGASLLRIKYNQQAAELNFAGRLGEARLPKQSRNSPDSHRGELEARMAEASVRVEETYTTPIQYHNPMEPHATIAWWEGEKLNLYDSTQAISGVKQTMARILNIPLDDVRVQCPFTGGGFGTKGSAWSHVPLAAMAAKQVKRPVKLALERPQMFGPVGARTRTVQKIRLGASADGKLLAQQHDVIMHAAKMEDFVEGAAEQTRMLYDSASNATSHRLVDLDIGVATYMRAPGKAPGTIALETAMDELAWKLKMDPVKLRLVNYAEKDPSDGKPWTSKHLRECYEQAATRFGWEKRPATPGAMREGNKLIGWGMATATYPAHRSPAAAIVKIKADGTAFVGSGTQDLGTGMYTIMAQTAAETLGLEPTQIEVKLGDSTLPKAPGSGGSQSTASVLPAVREAALQAKLKLAELAVNDAASPMHGAKAADIEMRGGRIGVKGDRGKSEALTALLARNTGSPIEAQATAEPAEDHDSMSAHSFGAVFVEVAVDAHTRMVQVRRVVGTYDIGSLQNAQTGMNQLMGGIVWGVSSALHEEAHLDPVHGRIVNENLGEYHVPVNADIGEIDVSVIGIPDTKLNPVGARGIGEIGITGVAAAIGNAIFHATGKRVREFPITLDKLLG